MAALNEPRSASNPASVRRPSRDAGRPLRPETVVSRSFRSPSDWLGILRLVASCWLAPPGCLRTIRPASGWRCPSSTVRYALACRLIAPCIPRDAGRRLLTADPLSRSLLGFRTSCRVGSAGCLRVEEFFQGGHDQPRWQKLGGQ